MTEVLDLAKRLIAAPSVTPATGPVFDAMEAMLGAEVPEAVAHFRALHALDVRAVQLYAQVVESVSDPWQRRHAGD